MRALGVISDKSIIEYCLLDLKANSNMIDLLVGCIKFADYNMLQCVKKNKSVKGFTPHALVLHNPII
jgi:hypothetical protein